MHRSHTHHRRGRLTVAAVASAVVLAAGCFPPEPSPAPSLPAGVGVSWLRDAGGQIVEDFGGPAYREAFERRITLDGVTTGPSQVTIPGAFPAPWWGVFGFDLGSASFPDGTAKFPWNGFAGEGITATTTPQSIEIAHPGGACTIGASMGLVVGGLSPSPDGTKLAFVGVDISGLGGFTIAWVTILDLTDFGPCSSVTSFVVDFSPQAPADHPTSGLVVWSPGSDAIAFPLAAQGGSLQQRIVRMDAAAGAAPVTVLHQADGCWVPLGWSIADRMLLSCVRELPGNPATVRSTLETMPVAGGIRQVIDTADASAITTATANTHLNHFGYFVPGTTTIVFNDGSEMSHTEDGSVPWYRMRLHDDSTGGEGSLTADEPHFATHDEPLLSDPGQTTSIPNVVMVERFVR